MPYTAEMIKHLPIWDWSHREDVHGTMSVDNTSSAIDFYVTTIVRLSCPFPASCHCDDSFTEDTSLKLRCHHFSQSRRFVTAS